MIVKEASYLSLEWRRLLQITDGTGAVEELPALGLRLLCHHFPKATLCS
jgi:hypothetical protein